jgi:hypothetical protein
MAAQGAAVLSLDHLVKDKKSQNRYAIGAVHKLNGLSGAGYILHTAEPCGRGLRGSSGVYVAKDRPGYIRKHAAGGTKDGMAHIADLVVDSRGDTELSLTCPELFDDARPMELMKKASRELQAVPGHGELTQNALCKLIGGNRQTAITAIHGLVSEGYASVRQDGRTSRIAYVGLFTGQPVAGSHEAIMEALSGV